ncbi:MAG: glycosyltransferase family 2 protein [Burkholderiales bacterium]|nr:glycosyltransferase family 2 protein [Flavobacterium sp.]
MEQIVTVAITTYNSGAYVLQTLHSIFNQTYQNIALIISDDFSVDDTLTLVSHWMNQEENQNRFRSIELITVTGNTGVSANCNRCIAAAPSDWIKFIAGDDILLPNCIEDNMLFVNKNPNAHVIFSQVKVYQDDFLEKNYLRTAPDAYPENLMNEGITAFNQFQLLLVSDRMHYTPSYFFKKEALLKVGGYDEGNRMVEDYPMWLKLTQSGERLCYFHLPTVGYRIHSKAINNVGDGVLFKPSLRNNFAVRKAIAHPFLPWEMVKSEQYIHWVSGFFQKCGWNKNTQWNSRWYHFAIFYTNPFYYWYALKKRLPANKNNPFYL